MAAERVRIRVSENKDQTTKLNMMDLAIVQTSQNGSMHNSEGDAIRSPWVRFNLIMVN